MYRNALNTTGAICGLALLSFFGAGQAAAQTIKDADNPARQPWAYKAQLNMPNGAHQDNEVFIVPAGKRLVIETYTIYYFVIGTQRLDASIEVTTAGNFVQHRLHKTYRSESPWTVAEATNNVRFYADPSSTVVLRVGRGANTDGNASGYITFSGHLVNLP